MASWGTWRGSDERMANFGHGLLRRTGAAKACSRRWLVQVCRERTR